MSDYGTIEVTLFESGRIRVSENGSTPLDHDSVDQVLETIKLTLESWMRDMKE